MERVIRELEKSANAPGHRRLRAADPLRSAGRSGKGAGGDGDRAGHGEAVAERQPQTKLRKPPMYKVLLLNDDYTPMEFVVHLLKSVFHKPHADATRIMLHVHQNGIGVAGVYPFEIAETKVRAVDELAREHQYPLKCVMEKE